MLYTKDTSFKKRDDDRQGWKKKMKRDKTSDERMEKKIEKPVGIKNVAMCDNDKQLLPRTPDRSKSL